MASLELRNVWKKYGEVVACQDVTWRCEDGEFFSLLGPSGCGKSSSMRMIAGLESITEGDIFFGERKVTNLPPRDRNVALVFENWALYPNMTVYDNIAFPLWVRNMPKDEIEKKVQWAAKFLDLSGILGYNVKGLSGGQQQRVSIGRAIVREPEVLLMDEPISHLDASLRSRMREELEALLRKLGVTTIYVTHDQVESMAMADRIAVMDKGLIQQIGTPKEIYSHPRNEFVAGFIGEPPMNFANCELTKSNGAIHLKSGSFNVELSQKVVDKIAAYQGSSKVKIGIRPEDVSVSPKVTNNNINANVDFVEVQGERNILTLRLAAGEIFLVEAASSIKPEIGSNIQIHFDLDHLHIFETATGLNLVY
jgi:multiple sugar transport system ATP-binding protein